MKQGGEKAYSDDQIKNIVNTHTHIHTKFIEELEHKIEEVSRKVDQNDEREQKEQTQAEK